jgi:Cu2+-containing amine oxidase
MQITMEDLQIVESIVRKDLKVIEQCGIIGIPPEDMHKVYCDRKWACTQCCVAANNKKPGPSATMSGSAPVSACNRL